MAKKLTPYGKRLVKLIVDGLLSTIALLFAVLSAGHLINGSQVPQYLAIACFFMVAIYITKFFFVERSRLYTIKIFGLAGAYISMMVLSILTVYDDLYYRVFAVIFFASVIYDAILSLIARPKIRYIILGVLKIVFSLLFILIFAFIDFTPEDPISVAFAFVPLFMAVIAFVHAMMMVFSGVRRTTLIQIIRKTYTIEILYGLIVLLVAISLVLTLVEENMTIWDALWYCFALVTTIGFGDVIVTSLVGRVLSVILGIYGIIVVALITSIIVNFYNETKDSDKTGEKQLREEIRELDQQREEEPEPEPEPVEEKVEEPEK